VRKFFFDSQSAPGRPGNPADPAARQGRQEMGRRGDAETEGASALYYYGWACLRRTKISVSAGGGSLGGLAVRWLGG
jgi:hypothetical protein